MFGIGDCSSVGGGFLQSLILDNVLFIEHWFPCFILAEEYGGMILSKPFRGSTIRACVLYLVAFSLLVKNKIVWVVIAILKLPGVQYFGTDSYMQTTVGVVA